MSVEDFRNKLDNVNKRLEETLNKLTKLCVEQERCLNIIINSKESNNIPECAIKNSIETKDISISYDEISKDYRQSDDYELMWKVAGKYGQNMHNKNVNSWMTEKIKQLKGLNKEKDQKYEIIPFEKAINQVDCSNFADRIVKTANFRQKAILVNRNDMLKPTIKIGI